MTDYNDGEGPGSNGGLFSAASLGQIRLDHTAQDASGWVAPATWLIPDRDEASAPSITVNRGGPDYSMSFDLGRVEPETISLLTGQQAATSSGAPTGIEMVTGWPRGQAQVEQQAEQRIRRRVPQLNIGDEVAIGTNRYRIVSLEMDEHNGIDAGFMPSEDYESQRDRG